MKKKILSPDEVYYLLNELGMDISDVLTDGITIDGDLIMAYAPNTVVNKLPDNMTVLGDLDLDYTEIGILPQKLKVAGSLFLSYTRIIEIPEDIIVEISLDLSHSLVKKLPEGLFVPSNLYLNHTPIAELPKSLIIGRGLILSYAPIKELPENLVVGGWIDFQHTQIRRLPKSLKVGKKIIPNDFIPKEGADRVSRLTEGEYVPGRYLYADGILTPVRRRKAFKGYVFYEGKNPERYVVTDGTYYAHCSSLRNGISDLAFKKAWDRGKEQYADMTLDSVLPAQEMIMMYRVITGACRQGAEDFVTSLGKLKPTYSVREAIEITKGQYGSDTFKSYFS